jgi:hypothetical protein
VSQQAQVIAFPLERTGTAPAARRLVPLKELQEQFGGSTRWWRYRIAEGMPARRYCASLRFDPDEVETWLKEHRHGV